MSDTRLIFALNRKVSTNGVKIRDFVYSNAHGLHIYKGKAYGVEEFNAVSQSVFSKHADLLPFAKVVSEAAATDSDSIPATAPTPAAIDALVADAERSPDEVAKAVAVLNAVDALLGTWPNANEEPITANIQRLIEENAAQAKSIAELEADESAPAIHHADKPKRKYVRRETVATKAKAAASLAEATA